MSQSSYVCVGPILDDREVPVELLNGRKQRQGMQVGLPSEDDARAKLISMVILRAAGIPRISQII